jgi:hypothetical protein
MKLISLWEPWATLMAIGAKRIETRSWSTSYRGWLAIQASKGGLSKRDLTDCLEEPSFKLALAGEALRPGHIVAVVNLVECFPTQARICLPGVFDDYPELDTQQERAFGDFSEGRWGWVTDHLFRLPEPIPFRAKQGLCDVDNASLVEIRRQWREGRPA